MPDETPTPNHPENTAPERPFKLGDFSIDKHKPIKVVCIGAGYSGIIAGIRYVIRGTLNLKLYTDRYSAAFRSAYLMYT